jgi:zinc transporter ZupT
MDTLGDADDFDDFDDDMYPPGSSSSLSSTESLAVAALAMAACSFFAGGLMQYISFTLSSPFDSPRGQYLLYISPTVLFAALAVALGLTVTRRGHGDRWTAGIAGAAVIVGGLVLVICLIGVVLVLTLESAQGLDF